MHAVVGVSVAAGLAALELVPARNQNLHCSTVISKQGKLSKLMLHTTVRSYRLYVFHCASFPQSLVRIASHEVLKAVACTSWPANCVPGLGIRLEVFVA